MPRASESNKRCWKKTGAAATAAAGSFVNVIAERPSLGHADRDWSKLNPEFVQVVLRVMEK